MNTMATHSRVQRMMKGTQAQPSTSENVAQTTPNVSHTTSQTEAEHFDISQGDEPMTEPSILLQDHRKNIEELEESAELHLRHQEYLTQQKAHQNAERLRSALASEQQQQEQHIQAGMQRLQQEALTSAAQVLQSEAYLSQQEQHIRREAEMLRMGVSQIGE